MSNCPCMKLLNQGAKNAKILASSFPIGFATLEITSNCAITVCGNKQLPTRDYQAFKELTISPINMHYLFERKQQRKKGFRNDFTIIAARSQNKTEERKKSQSTFFARFLHALKRSFLNFSSLRFSCFRLFLKVFLSLLSIFAFTKHVLWMNLLVHRARYEYECKEGTEKREPCETENVVSRRIV